MMARFRSRSIILAVPARRAPRESGSVFIGPAGCCNNDLLRWQVGEVVKISENVRKGKVCIGMEKNGRFTTRTGYPARAPI